MTYSAKMVCERATTDDEKRLKDDVLLPKPVRYSVSMWFFFQIPEVQVTPLSQGGGAPFTLRIDEGGSNVRRTELSVTVDANVECIEPLATTEDDPPPGVVDPTGPTPEPTQPQITEPGLEIRVEGGIFGN